MAGSQASTVSIQGSEGLGTPPPTMRMDSCIASQGHKWPPFRQWYNKACKSLTDACGLHRTNDLASLEVVARASFWVAGWRGGASVAVGMVRAGGGLGLGLAC